MKMEELQTGFWGYRKDSVYKLVASMEENFSSMLQYAPVFGRSFLLAFIATIVCILLGYPMAYFLARERGWLRRMATSPANATTAIAQPYQCARTARRQ